MTTESFVWHFCGSPLWDANLTWYTDTPQLPRCFERTVLAWIPCAFLWVLAPLETYYIIHSRDKHVPWSWVNLSKLVGSLVLLLLQLVDFFHALHQWRVGEPIYAVHFVTPALLFVSLFLQSAVVLVERKRGFQSSGYLFLFWLLCVVCFLPEYVSHISAGPYQEGEGVNFGTFMVFYPVTVGILLIHCFGDAPPRYVHYPRSHKYCPEVSASFLSKITFSWINSLIWKGYKQPLENGDLWDISYENASSTIVDKWNKSWKKNSAKAYNKGQSHTYATFNNTDQVELSGQAGNKEHYLSILPILVKVFSSSFCFGAFLKFLHDVLQFLSPQILSALITFTESTQEEAPAWHGILYAVLMLVCAQCQSFLLGQYFAWMMVVGLRMRTGIISAVYGKAMRISSSAKKESTVGEIVNLMSVDAQRFMDITTYINMLWSAPMQIILAIYFLWNLLGPSVLAGLAVMIVLIPINGFIANQTKKLQIKQMKLKDERVKLMNEILNGIKVLKLYAWEPSFESQVTSVRNKEVKVLREAAYFNAGTNFIWNCAPFMVSVATFAVYVNVSPDNILDAKTAFVSLSLFNLLRFPLAMLPMLITSMVQAHVSLKRINRFMNADELDPNSVQGDPTYKHPIVVENGTFAWGHEEEDSKPVLKGLNLTIQTGSLVAVVGTVGTGKSSLLSAILGEMEKQSGRVNVKGKVAYVAQQAWIQNTTLEKNILFNQPKVDDVYEACLRSCALQSDLAILPGGDQTEIGEKGINLSGGQKQRVSLARAIYSDADIFLLDDPLSAVDSHVGKHIFDHVIGHNGILKNKTRVLVTHGLTYLPQTDRIIVLKDNQISEQGTFKELLQKKGPFQEFLLQYLASDSEELDNLEELEDIKHQLESSLGRDVVEQQLVREKRASESESLADSDCSKHAVHRQSSQRISESSVGKEPQSPPSKRKGEKLIEAEKTETGRVQTEVYKYYIKSIGIPILIWTMCCFVVAQSCIVGSSVWLSIWSEDTNMDSSTTDMYLGVYGALGIGQGRLTMSAEQRTNLKFLVQLGKTPSEALGMLQKVYGDETMSRSRVFEWCKRFKEGREDVEDDPRSGRPSTSRNEANVERVKQMVRDDRRLTVRKIADELGMNHNSVWKIITEDLGMRKVCAKMVPRLLNDDQKGRRMQVCQDILERLETEPDLLRRVITGDESWVFEYDPETKRQSLQWKSPASPRPKKARQSRSSFKVMLIAFFDVRGIVHCEFLPQGQTVNQHVYKEVLRRLLRAVREKRRELWQGNSWLLHHDNAPAHNALSIREFLAKKNIAVLEQPPYSPDLAPCDFFLFPKLKEVMKGTRFDDADDIKKAVTTELRSIPQESFQQCMQAWQRRMDKCMRCQGDYFEGDNL